ncbi:MAG: GNAT family N-acetyltransferase [Desulfomicrobium sp.]|nr:GNAT family N-acetyltransferase [Pseudomonadota bacterium]MBV1711664.1 GNAT family N-acetyltransferase [Desulfomicrobium sp.]MBU4569728.1 GNAT family N-acetyltransferase [Pseudomonadota bacterium]MBU4595448.1 GNAT family N-acetyltransferase [Pseudomonadota bacterium]MBV1718739.1 GNAT family N-acetyltransferase [Desulfomicrobium sp.]
MLPAYFDNITVRYLEPKDYEPYAALETDEEAKLYVGGPIKNRTREQIVQFMNYQPTTSLLALADPLLDNYVGRCGFLDQDGTSETEIHIVLAREARKRGIAKTVVPLLAELARSLGKIPMAIVDPENVRSRSLMNALGWKEIGIIDKENYQKGHIRYEPDSI